MAVIFASKPEHVVPSCDIVTIVVFLMFIII